MPSQSNKVKILKIIDEEYAYIKKTADLIAACPHVVPSGIGIDKYLEELEKSAVSLQKYLYARAAERAKAAEWIVY